MNEPKFEVGKRYLFGNQIPSDGVYRCLSTDASKLRPIVLLNEVSGSCFQTYMNACTCYKEYKEPEYRYINLYTKDLKGTVFQNESRKEADYVALESRIGVIKYDINNPPWDK